MKLLAVVALCLGVVWGASLLLEGIRDQVMLALYYGYGR